MSCYSTYSGCRNRAWCVLRKLLFFLLFLTVGIRLKGGQIGLQLGVMKAIVVSVSNSNALKMPQIVREFLACHFLHSAPHVDVSRVLQSC